MIWIKFCGSGLNQTLSCNFSSGQYRFNITSALYEVQTEPYRFFQKTAHTKKKISTRKNMETLLRSAVFFLDIIRCCVYLIKYIQK